MSEGLEVTRCVDFEEAMALNKAGIKKAFEAKDSSLENVLERVFVALINYVVHYTLEKREASDAMMLAVLDIIVICRDILKMSDDAAVDTAHRLARIFEEELVQGGLKEFGLSLE